MSELLHEGEVWSWPVEPSRASQIVRVRLIHGSECIIDKFKELHVRAEVVRQVAYLYIENHMQDLAQLRGAQIIHARMKGHSTQDSLRKHVDARVDKYYPASEYPTHGGGVMPELREMV